MLAPGRRHDAAMLEERIKSAKSVQERERAEAKMDFIVKEGRDPVLRNLRGKLLNAAKANDNEAGDQISEQIYLHVNKG